MGEPLPKQVLDSAVDPDEIVQQTFDPARRGYDQQQVQQYLRAVASSLHDAQRREADMRSRLGKAVRRADAAEKSLRESPPADATDTNRQLGDEVTSVLDAARAAGEQQIVAARKSAEKVLTSAKADATRLRSEAEAVLEQRRTEAGAKAADVVADARAEAAAISDQAKAEAEALLTRAADRVERARNDCDALIHEAEEARAQILEDMERRRRQARAQVERLRVGRDRLLRSYDVVRRTLDETTTDLKSSLKEAKVRGDSAARDINSQPLSTRQQLETELADAKLIGRIKISDPAAPPAPQVLRSPALPRPLDPPPALDPPHAEQPGDSSPPTPKKPRVSQLMKQAGVTRSPAQPQAPAFAPVLKASPPADENDEALEAELATLEDDNLDVVEPTDDIEEVTALPSDDGGAGSELFALLRIQSSGKAKPKAKPKAKKQSKKSAAPQTDSLVEFPGLDAQRDAVIADAAKQLEQRLRRALADEQNDLLASIRAAKKKRNLELTALVGDVDTHIKRYVVAIHEVAAVTYGAGAALIDAEPTEGLLPAGAVEELLEVDVVLPIRERLEALDAQQVDSAGHHVDPVRSFYRERKTDHLGHAASRLAQLLCVAGLHDAQS